APEGGLAGARRRYDPAGAVTVTGALLLLVYSISNAPQAGWGSARTVALLAVSAALLAAFVVIEARATAPLMPLRIFRLRMLAVSNAVGLLVGGRFLGFIFGGTRYMQQVLGYSALQAGIAWLAASLTSVALAGLSQRLVTLISPGPVMALGMALIAGGILWATQVPVHGHFWAALAGPFFVAGAGTAFAFIPVSIGGLTGVARHEAGLASRLLTPPQQRSAPRARAGGRRGSRRRRGRPPPPRPPAPAGARRAGAPPPGASGGGLGPAERSPPPPPPATAPLLPRRKRAPAGLHDAVPAAG